MTPAAARVRAAAVAIAAAAVPLALLVGVLLASSLAPPATSLGVFTIAPSAPDREVAAAITLSDGDRSTARKLGEADGWVAFAFRTDSGDVCLQVTFVEADSASCVTEAAFREGGVEVASAFRVEGALVRGAWHWGPREGLSFTQHRR